MSGTPFKMKGHTLPGPFQKKSPAKNPEVFIDGVSQGTGPEAVKAGITAERDNKQLGLGLNEAKKAKEVTYTDADAKARMSASYGKEKKSQQEELKKTGKVSGRGTVRAKASKKI